MHCNGAINERIVLMCWQKMDSSINRIKMNNGKMWITSVVCVRFDHPKSRVLLRFGAHMRIPLNQCTRIFFVLVSK